MVHCEVGLRLTCPGAGRALNPFPVPPDDRLHFVSGDRVRLVLRNRQQVEAALVDFHDELNHLNVNKCLRLLNERFVLIAPTLVLPSA